MRNSTPSEAGWYLDEYDGPRFWTKVDFHGGQPYLDDPVSNLREDAGECWEWRGWVTHQGYSRFRLADRGKYAHRIAYREFGRKIPEGYQIDHLCRNRRCVNPSHLEAVTPQVNMDRSVFGYRRRQGDAA